MVLENIHTPHGGFFFEFDPPPRIFHATVVSGTSPIPWNFHDFLLGSPYPLEISYLLGTVKVTTLSHSYSCLYCRWRCKAAYFFHKTYRDVLSIVIVITVNLWSHNVRSFMQGFWYFVRLQSHKFQVNLQNPEIHINMRNPTKFARKSYQIHVGTTYLKVILAVGAAYLL